MEVKINREIREFTENIFFGLSLRQFFFSVLACITAVMIYFVTKPYVGKETISWLCILSALPFVFLGFFKYNGMPAEKFIVCWLKSELLFPKKLSFNPTNFYYELTKNKIEDIRKEGLNDENIEDIIQK